MFPPPFTGLLFGLLTAAVLTTGAAQAVDTPGKSSENADPAFERYVDLGLLVTAWSDKNAALLADIGLQLAEGERVLFRYHKAITADQVLTMAVRVAVEKRDAATLARLGKALEALKKSDLAAELAGAQKLASASRAPAPALAVAAEAMSPEVFLLFRDTLDAITSAKVDGDAEALDIIIQLAPEMTRIPDAQRKHLIKAATDARAALPKEPTGIDPAAEALNKLLDPSRVHKNVNRDCRALGVKYVFSNKGFRVVGLTEGSSAALKNSAKLNMNDLILRVGGQACTNPAANLDEMVAAAMKGTDRKLLVYEAKTGKVHSYEVLVSPPPVKK